MRFFIKRFEIGIKGMRRSGWTNSDKKSADHFTLHISTYRVSQNSSASRTVDIDWSKLKRTVMYHLVQIAMVLLSNMLNRLRANERSESDRPDSVSVYKERWLRALICLNNLVNYSITIAIKTK